MNGGDTFRTSWGVKHFRAPAILSRMLVVPVMVLHILLELSKACICETRHTYIQTFKLYCYSVAKTFIGDLKPDF